MSDNEKAQEVFDQVWALMKAAGFDTFMLSMHRRDADHCYTTAKGTVLDVYKLLVSTHKHLDKQTEQLIKQQDETN